MNAKFIITGDPTQVDLPYKQKSGLKEAMHILENIKEIGFVYLNEADVVRHPVVKKIISAYNEEEKRQSSNKIKAVSEIETAFKFIYNQNSLNLFHFYANLF